MENFAKKLITQGVKPIGLGARDTLRLEAGLCLYGHDINESTSPIEANLKWAISKRRREEGGFVGYEKIKSDLNGSNFFVIFRKNLNSFSCYNFSFGLNTNS